MGKTLCVGVAGIVGVGVVSAAKTVNDCVIVVNMPEESRDFIVSV